MKEFIVKLLNTVLNFFKRLPRRVSIFFKKLPGRIVIFFKASKKRIWNFFASDAGQSFINSLIAVGIGLLIGFIVMLITKPLKSFDGMGRILTGGFALGMQSVGNTLHNAAPIILTGLAFAFASKTGLFNIGGSGQFMVGGVFALYAANLVTLPTGIHFIFCILVAIVAAGIWGAIAGVLKAIFNVSEVISTIMLNYIGMHLSVMMVLNPLVYNKAITAINIDHPTANTPFFLLDKIFKGSYIDISIIMAIVICVLIAFILNKTTFGYQLKAVGNSSEGSKYAGIAYKRNVVTTMFISGALAGLGGALTFLPANPAFFSSHEIVMSQGFDGMSVALIANSNPIGIIFSGLFISYLKSGTLSMQLAGYNREIGNIVISAIIYMSALSAFIGGAVKKRFRNRRTKRELEAKGVTINE